MKLPVNAFPQPGFVVARPTPVMEHCGILDYDGAWISGGTFNVNRKAHLEQTYYKPASFRKYIF